MRNVYLIIGSILVIVLSLVLIFDLTSVVTFLKHLLALVVTFCLYMYLAIQAPSKLFEKLYYEKKYSQSAVWLACVSVWIFSYVGLGWYFEFILSVVDSENIKLFFNLMGPMLSLIVAVVGVLTSTVRSLNTKDKNN